MNISTFLGCDSGFEESGTVIFGAPFDGTVSFRPGTRFAPAAMRRDSEGLETYSPYLERDITELSVFDGGDLCLPFGNTEKTLEIIETHSREILSANKKFVMIGGEHLVTLAALRAVHEKYPDLRVIHFDAHTDMRDEYMGEKLSHACVMRRCHELLGDGRIYQFGIRSGERVEFLFSKEHCILERFTLSGAAAAAKACEGYPVYISVDLDVLDPSVFPGTGTPEAGGVSFNELLQALFVFKGCNIVSADITELSPDYDRSGVSTAVACKVLRELILTMEG